MKIEKRVDKLEKDSKKIKTILISILGILTVSGIIALVKENKYSEFKKIGLNKLKNNTNSDFKIIIIEYSKLNLYKFVFKTFKKYIIYSTI